MPRWTLLSLPILVLLAVSPAVHGLAKPPEGVCTHKEGVIFDGAQVYLSFSANSEHGLGACCSACHDFLPCTGYNAYQLDGDNIRCELLTGSLEGVEQAALEGAGLKLGSGAITPLANDEDIDTVHHRMAAEVTFSKGSLCGCRYCAAPASSAPTSSPIRAKPPSPPAFPTSGKAGPGLGRLPTGGLSVSPKSSPKISGAPDFKVTGK